MISHVSHNSHPVSRVNCQLVAVTANYKVSRAITVHTAAAARHVTPNCNISNIRTSEVLSVALLNIHVLWAVTPSR